MKPENKPPKYSTPTVSTSRTPKSSQPKAPIYLKGQRNDLNPNIPQIIAESQKIDEQEKVVQKIAQPINKRSRDITAQIFHTNRQHVSDAKKLAVERPIYLKVEAGKEYGRGQEKVSQKIDEPITKHAATIVGNKSRHEKSPVSQKIDELETKHNRVDDTV